VSGLGPLLAALPMRLSRAAGCTRAQAAVLEHSQIASLSAADFPLLLAFACALYCFYALVPRVLLRGGAAVLNVSLLVCVGHCEGQARACLKGVQWWWRRALCGVCSGPQGRGSWASGVRRCRPHATHSTSRLTCSYPMSG
jgi:hypothetical protein